MKRQKVGDPSNLRQVFNF